MMRATLTLLLLFVAWHRQADAFATSPPRNAINSVEAKVLREWLLVGDRYSSTAAVVEADEDNDGKCVVVTTRDVARGEVLIRLKKNAIWSASAAYADRDIGPKLRDYAAKAGPGFSSVALAGGLAAEKVRRYRLREGLGVAPESSGFTVPSKWGAFARYLWSAYDKTGKKIDIDESLAGVIQQGVNLLVPLLDVAARRYWTLDAADEPETSVADEEWTRRALLNDGAPRSWSRTELEAVAMDSMVLVLEQARSPPSFVLDGEVGSLVPDPFVDKASDLPEMWQNGEDLAFIPLMDDLFQKKEEKDEPNKPNAIIGTPPRKRHGGEDDCIWCVATRGLNAGEQVSIANPWA